MDSKQAVRVIENAVKSGEFTPAKIVDLNTFVCWTEVTPHGKVWHQWHLEQLTEDQRRLFIGRSLGETFGFCKIIAVFDVWRDEFVTKTVPIRVAS